MSRRPEKNDPLRGEVWSADLGDAAKPRRVIILSRDDLDKPRRLTVYVPVTLQNRGSRYEVEMPHTSFLKPGSTANVQGIASGESADEQLFIKKLGSLPADAIAKIEQALLFSIGMAN